VSTVCELAATIALAYSFYKSRTGIRRTDAILSRLFTFVVTRGLLLSVIQILSMVLFFARPDKEYWIPFHLFQSKFYVITMRESFFF
ncbi:hypothetical protein K435DRAFT_621941, partial [Dendrothele bispora CBS 962.96]